MGRCALDRHSNSGVCRYRVLSGMTGWKCCLHVQVGTYIGERLIYAPSIGFCILLAELLSNLAGDALPQILLLWYSGGCKPILICQSPFGDCSCPSIYSSEAHR